MRHILLASDMSGCLPEIIGLLEERRRGNRLLYIPTAAYWEFDAEEDLAPFRAAGYDCTVFDLAGKTREQTKAALDGSDMCFVGGGNTFRLLHCMKTSGFFDLIHAHLDDGYVYMGSSAGSVAACPDIGFADTVDDRSRGGNLGDDGLALIDRPILPHMDHYSMGPAVRAIARGFEARGIDYIPLNDGELHVVADAPRPMAEAVVRP